jgi:hypothetical protein
MAFEEEKDDSPAVDNAPAAALTGDQLERQRVNANWIRATSTSWEILGGGYRHVWPLLLPIGCWLCAGGEGGSATSRGCVA